MRHGNVRQAQGGVRYWLLTRLARDAAWGQGYSMANGGRFKKDDSGITWKNDPALGEIYSEWYGRGYDWGRAVFGLKLLVLGLLAGAAGILYVYAGR